MNFRWLSVIMLCCKVKCKGHMFLCCRSRSVIVSLRGIYFISDMCLHSDMSG